MIVAGISVVKSADDGFDDPYALIDDLARDIKGGTESYALGAATKDEQSMFVGFIDERGAYVRIRKVEGGEESTTSDV